MEMQSLGITLVNTSMIMATVLLLRERVARKRRMDAEDQDLVMDLSAWDKTKIPFLKRNSSKTSLVVLALIGAFLIWIGVKNFQALIETVLMAIIAGGMFLYMKQIDEKKKTGAYKKGILHKTGFAYYHSITGYKTAKSDEYAHATDVWLIIGNTPRIQVHVANDQVKAFEKELRKNIRLQNGQ